MLLENGTTLPPLLPGVPFHQPTNIDEHCPLYFREMLSVAFVFLLFGAVVAAPIGHAQNCPSLYHTGVW